MIKLLQDVNELQKKLSEKEEALKSAEDLLNQMSTAYASLEDLRSQVAEKDSLVKSSNLELYNVKVQYFSELSCCFYMCIMFFLINFYRKICLAYLK